MALTRSVLSFGVDHSAHCQLQPPATTGVFSIWTRMTGAITMSFATLCKPPITILGQDWLLAVDHKQLKWPSSTPNFKVCFRRGASGPIGVCKKTVSLQAKEKKTPHFFPITIWLFLNIHIYQSFSWRRGGNWGTGTLAKTLRLPARGAELRPRCTAPRWSPPTLSPTQETWILLVALAKPLGQRFARVNNSCESNGGTFLHHDSVFIPAGLPGLSSEFREPPRKRSDGMPGDRQSLL